MCYGRDQRMSVWTNALNQEIREYVEIREFEEVQEQRNKSRAPIDTFIK